MHSQTCLDTQKKKKKKATWNNEVGLNITGKTK